MSILLKRPEHADISAVHLLTGPRVLLHVLQVGLKENQSNFFSSPWVEIDQPKGGLHVAVEFLEVHG